MQFNTERNGKYKCFRMKYINEIINYLFFKKKIKMHFEVSKFKEKYNNAKNILKYQGVFH